MTEELKPCPFCHREAQQTLCSGLVSCAYEDCPAFLLAVFPESWNARAKLPSQGGEAIAWRRRDEVMGCKRFMTQKCYDAQSPQMKGNYEPFYCAHCKADQVAEPDAELVELLRNKFPRIDPCQPAPLDQKAHCCEYTIYVERERLHRLIDAKLASLEQNQ